MTGAPTSASTGSPLARRSFIPGTPRFVRFIALFAGAGPGEMLTWTPSPTRRDRSQDVSDDTCSSQDGYGQRQEDEDRPDPNARAAREW